jgi:hypothetical protein
MILVKFSRASGYALTGLIVLARQHTGHAMHDSSSIRAAPA